MPFSERVMLSQMDCTSIEMFVKGMTLSPVSGARKKQGGDNTGKGGLKDDRTKAWSETSEALRVEKGCNSQRGFSAPKQFNFNDNNFLECLHEGDTETQSRLSRDGDGGVGKQIGSVIDVYLG